MKCLCQCGFFKDYITYQKDFDKKYNSQRDILHIHNNYCITHYNYLKKYKEEYDNFLTYNNDRWITKMREKMFYDVLIKKPDELDLDETEFEYIRFSND